MKTTLYLHIEQQIEDKIKYLQSLIDDLRSSNNDTKSSMGDKYETSREMMQQEITRIQNQLNEVLVQQEIFSKIKIVENEVIGLGSYIETTMGNFCIACSFGEIKVEDKKIFVLSSQTPLSKIISGKMVNETFEMNGKSFTIKKVE
jgi:transcription elongation GreA/GreB family factor